MFMGLNFESHYDYPKSLMIRSIGPNTGPSRFPCSWDVDNPH